MSLVCQSLQTMAMQSTFLFATLAVATLYLNKSLLGCKINWARTRQRSLQMHLMTSSGLPLRVSRSTDLSMTYKSLNRCLTKTGKLIGLTP